MPPYDPYKLYGPKIGEASAAPGLSGGPTSMPAASLGSGAQPTAPAKPPTNADRYRDLAAEEPDRANFPAQSMPWWKKALGLVSAAAGGLGRKDDTTYKLAREVLNAPQANAEKQYEQEHGAWQRKMDAVQKESGIENTASEIAERDARTQNLLNPPKKDETGKTPEEVTIHDMMTGGENGGPRINPQTNKPYSYLEAYGAVKQAAQDTKPDKTQLDKKIDEFVDPNNNRINVMQRPDGTTYNTRRGSVRPEGSAAPGSSADDPKQIADAIIRGEQPPDLKGLYRTNAPVRAELARRGFNLARADEDWHATQKYLATLNGAQQVRLRQAVGFTRDSLDQLESIYNEWQKVGVTNGWKTFNKASIATSKQLPGEAGDLAHRLEARIADLNSELGTVYKGGNSSTDESLKLASKNLSGDWNEKTFRDALKDIRQSLQIRENSIRNTQVQGASDNSPYKPGGVGEAQRDYGAAPAGKKDGDTGTMKVDGKDVKVVVKGGRVVTQQQ